MVHLVRIRSALELGCDPILRLFMSGVAHHFHHISHLDYAIASVDLFDRHSLVGAHLATQHFRDAIIILSRDSFGEWNGRTGVRLILWIVLGISVHHYDLLKSSCLFPAIDRNELSLVAKNGTGL